ncbi:MAG: hypothetical protein M3Y71_17395 [Actinomycetota bacterium]|nr:hypothetical protein [Actinomycetota bacterium]
MRHAEPALVDAGAPFTFAAALGEGLTRRELESVQFVRVFHGVYVSRAVTRTLLVRTRAALLVAPRSAVVSHHTAAQLYGGYVPASSSIHLSMKAPLNCKQAGIRPHRVQRPPTAAAWRGVPITSPERTFCDLGGALDLVELVVLGDRLVRRGRTTPERLRAAADSWDGSHARVLRRAAGLVRVGVDSRPETQLRMLMVLAGLPEPEVDIRFDNPQTGDLERRLDTGYRDLRLGIEYDGAQHREDEEVYEADITRHEEIREKRRWRLMRVTRKGVYDVPLATLLRIDDARVDRGARPTVFRDEWQAYFPGKGI